MEFISYQEWVKSCKLPRPEARILLHKIAGVRAVEWAAHPDTLLSSEQYCALQAAVHRRLLGEPIAYILGSREFYGRDFIVSKDVLIPRPETEHLLEKVLSVLPRGGSQCVWDIGTGSGILSISIKLERPECEVWASDISEAALKIAQKNAQRWGARINFTQGSWFDCVPKPDLCTAIVSNPPYIESTDAHLSQGDLRFEPQNALTDFHDGLSAFRILTCHARAVLQCGGLLAMEHGFNQGAEVRHLLHQAGFKNVATEQDLAGLDRLSFGYAPS